MANTAGQQLRPSSSGEKKQFQPQPLRLRTGAPRLAALRRNIDFPPASAALRFASLGSAVKHLLFSEEDLRCHRQANRYKGGCLTAPCRICPYDAACGCYRSNSACHLSTLFDPYIHMRFLISLVLSSASAVTLLAEDALPSVHKSSTSKLYKPNVEVLSYYSDLMEHNSNVKQQFDALAKKLVPHFGQVHSCPGDPTAVEWFPRDGSSFITEDIDVDTRYLVIHPLEFIRVGHLDYEGMVVSEFRVQHKGTIKNPAQTTEKVESNEITITFLGFRQFALTKATLSPEQSFKQVDADLNRTYKELQSRLESPQAKAELAKAQRAWIAFRDADSAFRAKINSEKEDVAKLADDLTNQIELTVQRTQQLKSQSDKLE